MKLLGFGGFANKRYWSSTEAGTNYAWLFNFANGNASNDYKYYTFYVRAVRAF